MRTVGVEEELLLVDPSSGAPLAVASAVVMDKPQSASGKGPGGGLQLELQEQQIETGSRPHHSLPGLAHDLSSWRLRADQAAREAGARVAALATSPLPVRPETVAKGRYQRMAELYGMLEQEQLTCGCHIHVSLDSAAEGVAVLDRIRVWLPTLTALSANSPFWQGRDTGYASYRSQVWARWPSAGPIEVQESETNYRALVADLLATGAAMDEGMVYFDARLSATYPTVEVRVPDVCLRVGDAVTIAGLVRALVDTAVHEWRDGRPPPYVPALLVRAAGWHAARWGLSGQLAHPRVGGTRPAATVLEDLVDYLAPALRANGDSDMVSEGINAILADGNGATQQRQSYQPRTSMTDVVADAIERTQAR